MTENTRHASRLTIGELSRLTGVPVRTLRFYCDNGILDSRRSGGGHRMFDSSAAERVRQIRRLRALHVSLPAILAVLDDDRSLTDALRAERTALELELDGLSWRRASLLALEAAPPEQRAARLELLAAVQDRRHAYDTLITRWRSLLGPLPADMFDGFAAMNIPRPPADPTPAGVVAYAEIASYATDPGWSAAMSRLLWRSDPSAIRDRAGLTVELAAICTDVDGLCAAGTAPRPGPELDRFVRAHAAARRTADTPALRRRLLGDSNNAGAQRYWQLTTEITGERTTGAAMSWLLRSLERWAAEPGPQVSA
ncbi:MerR family transcriptional regulator [Nocardia inohanensis]|uniref:MerR family transcriptional regulator n=1 Tax=Nocardia inohanensis TaxID=209246 RepID=UPI000B0EC0E8|nr:MerR family transcriptional regulator [Nocardia inohanensis]